MSFSPCTRRIVVVDDDHMIRHFATKKLEPEGFKVLTAANANEAMGLLQAHDDVRAVVTDVDMPGMSGLDLARAVREHSPMMGIVIMSGRSQIEPLPRNCTFLPKTLLVSGLVAHVQQAVARTEAQLAEPSQSSR